MHQPQGCGAGCKSGRGTLAEEKREKLEQSQTEKRCKEQGARRRESSEGGGS